MKKSLVSMVLVVSMLVLLGGKAMAAETRATTAKPTLSFEGTTATCQVNITAVGKQITATLELWQGNTLIESWDGTAATRLIISETCTVTSGKTYTLKVSGTIGGVAFEETSVSATCN